jgi:CcmD family protein
MKYTLFFLPLLFFFAIKSQAQSTDTVEMADVLRNSGKIYVVVAVMSIVFIGVIFYLFSIDQRLKKIENDQIGS